MRIAVLVRNYNRNAGGAERYCVELSERLSETNEVHVYSQTFDETSTSIKFHKIAKYFDKPRFLNQLLFSQHLESINHEPHLKPFLNLRKRAQEPYPFLLYIQFYSNFLSIG